MRYSAEEIRQYAAEEDVKFIRMAFCDVEGRQKNIAIMPSRAGAGVPATALPLTAPPFPASAGRCTPTCCCTRIPPPCACCRGVRSMDRVVRMFCCRDPPRTGRSLRRTPGACCKGQWADAKAAGLTFAFGTEMEFYLFRRDEDGESHPDPYDDAGYMDIAPADKGENVRREVCLTLEQMGIQPGEFPP